MSILGCGAEMKALMKVSNEDIDIINATLKERMDLGVPRKEAQQQAVAEAIALLELERQEVLAAVREKLAGMEKGEEESNLFKTKRAADAARKNHPMMRVRRVAGGFALVEKTPKQIEAQEKAAKRLSQPNTSPRGEPIPAHAMIAAEGGLVPDLRSDMGMDGNVTIGNRKLFAAEGRGLTIEQATEKLIEEGYLQEGASHSRAMDLIKRSITNPQYTPDGTERMAAKELQAREDAFNAEQEALALAQEADDTVFDIASRAFEEAMLNEPQGLGQGDMSMEDALLMAGYTLEEIQNEQRNSDAGAQADQGAVEIAAESGAQDNEGRGGTTGEDQGNGEEGLTAPTRADILAQQERTDSAAQSKEKADRAADKKAREEEDRKRIAKASEAAADTFELGGDAMANLTGQKDIFEPKARYGTKTAIANEPQPDYTGHYEIDLFGDPLPTTAGKDRATRSDGKRVQGDVQPTRSISDTEPPRGEYYANTIVGTETNRELGAARIVTPDHAAQATRYLYKSAVERLDGIVTDKNYRPIAVIGGFKGAVSQASVYPSTLMAEAIRIPGAAYVWFSHNHPSGQSMLSRADEALNRHLADVFRGSGIEPLGTLAVAGDRYSYVDNQGNVHAERSIPPSISKKTTPVITRELGTGKDQYEAISSPIAAKSLAKTFYNKAKEPGIILLNAQNAVVGWLPISKGMMGPLRGTGGAASVYRAVSQSNAGAAIIVHGGELDGVWKNGLPNISASQNIAAALKLVDVLPLDSINATTGESAAERGLDVSSGPMFSTRTSAPEKQLSLQQIERLVQSALRGMKNAPTVRVVANPEAIGLRTPVDTVPSGVTLANGDVYVFQSGIGSALDVDMVIFHELFHKGLQNVMPRSDYVAAMQDIAKIDAKVRQYASEWSDSNAGKDKLKELAKKYSGKELADQYEALATEEGLARIAEDLKAKREMGTKDMRVRRLVSWLAKLADKIGMTRLADSLRAMSYSEAEKFVIATIGRAGGRGAGAGVRYSAGMTNHDVVGNQGGRSADDTTPEHVNPVERVKQAARDAFSIYQRRTGAEGDAASFEVDDNDTPVSFRAGAVAQELRNLGWEIVSGDYAAYASNDASQYFDVRKQVSDDTEDGPEYVTAKVRVSNHGNTTKATTQPNVNIAPGEDIVWDIEEKLNQKITDEGYDLPVNAPSDARLGYAIATEQAQRGKPSDGSGGNTTTNESTAPDSGGARFRAADTLNAAANNATVNKVVDKLNEHFTHPGKVSWWDKTVGSPYHLSERSPAFKRVFEAVQRFINDVSFYANEAADLAPKLLPKLDTWRDLGKQPISAADNTAIAAPIYEGTLSWTRDEAGKPVRVADDETAGIVFTDAELKSLFNLTPEQIGLYHQFRDATDKSLDNMAKAEMLRYGGKDVVGLRDMVMDAQDANDAAVLLRDHLIELAKDDEARAGALTETAHGMIERSDKVDKLKKKGYAPLSRFGRYSVDVVVAGKREYFGLFETVHDSNKMAAKMKMMHGAANVAQGTMSQKQFQLFQGITPESLELFGNMLGLESDGDKASDKAFQDYLRLTKNNRSAMKRLIHRKGIAGYSEDVGRTLAAFVYSNARQTAAGLHMGEMGEAVNDIPKVEGELKDAAIELTEYVKNPREEAQALRGLMFAQYLGGSVASAFVNFTQPMTVSFPYLSQFGGAGKAGAALIQAMKDQRAGKVLEPGLARALKIADETGTTQPQAVHELMAQSRGAATLKAGDGTRMGDASALVGNSVAKVALGWGKLFGLAEQINRRSTFIAAYRIAVEQKITDPAGFATKAVNETQFINNKGNKAKFGRGAIGATLMAFKSYSINYLELLHRMATRNGPEGKKAAALMLGMLFLMAGAGGMPGADDLDDVIDLFAQRLGYNFSSQKAKQEFLEGLFGKAGAQFIERGITGLPGAPIDVSGRMSMGNLIPGTGLLLKKSDHTRDVTEVAGAFGDMAIRAFKAGDQLLSGDLGKAILTASPKAASNFAQGVDMASSGMYKDAKGYKVIDTTPTEAAMKAIGFQPASVSKVQEANYLNQRAKDFYSLHAADIRSRWAKGIFEDDKDQVQAARDMMKTWNDNNPDQRIMPNMVAIMRKVHEMRKTKEQRIADTAPKAMRATLRQQIAERAAQ